MLFRQACAIESAAMRNPNRDIFVLFASPVGVKQSGCSNEFIEVLLKYPNIHLRNLNLWRYLFQTPVFEWIKTNALFESEYLFEHMADMLRIVTLFKYGGFYMDLDVIVMKNVDDVGENFVVNDWYDVANNAVLHLKNYGIGRELTQRTLK